MTTVLIKFRRDTRENWSIEDPVLAEGEPGYETDTKKFKIGDGEARWSDLEYYGPGTLDDYYASQEELDDHISDPTPHSAYDDGPSLVLRYFNAKV